MAAVEGPTPKYECLLFDLDDTLYPLGAGINLACRKNIQDYMRDHLQIEESQIAEMCLELYRDYGTTMAGLKALGYEFDNDEFHANVHGRLPYDNLRPDPVLRILLLSIPQRKILFTNSDKVHAEEVLRRLGLEDCFEGVICFETLNPPAAPSNVLRKSQENYVIFFDDSTRNIASGKAAGFHTVIVGRSELVPGADHALESIHNIREALPEIWDGHDDWLESDADAVLASADVETAVVA
uniref:Uncharacterized protein n=1 Tax=Avena sativa TaxID=4498 RepID=A0ACD6AA76_AVESA